MIAIKRTPIEDLVSPDEESAKGRPTEAAIEALAALLIDFHFKRKERRGDQAEDARRLTG